VANATGVWLHETPFTPRRVLEALAAAGVEQES
jgi:CO/xanthine dehydrogenase Mo-binding subunit